jgi:DNA-directed RNA polymerase subunit RPC12/RpoP
MKYKCKQCGSHVLELSEGWFMCSWLQCEYCRGEEIVNGELPCWMEEVQE